MKRLLAIIIVFICSLSAFAQKDITLFRGIPVDGTKEDMIQKLIEKGYTLSDKDVLTGEFNGVDVHIFIATNNNKVCRIMVCDANPINETDIRIRFNRLCEQFKNNDKYIPVTLSTDEFIIPDDENISYEMNIKHKRYEASFYQKLTEETTNVLHNQLIEHFQSKYTEEQLSNPTDDIQKELVSMAFNMALEYQSKKLVWFTISEYYGKYYITLFYDNEYNRANGEDL